jgi:hypothetical protein
MCFQFWRPITAWFSIYSLKFRFIDTKLRCNGPSKPGAHYFQQHRDCNKGGICGKREKSSLTSYYDVIHWKLTILCNLIHNYTNGWWTLLKSVRPFTLLTGIQLAPDFIMRLGVAARMASPAVQGIMAIQEEWLWPLYIQYSAHVLVPAQVWNGNLSRYNFQIREYNWWWNLAFETISYRIHWIPINSLNCIFGCENVRFSFKIITTLDG